MLSCLSKCLHSNRLHCEHGKYYTRETSEMLSFHFWLKGETFSFRERSLLTDLFLFPLKKLNKQTDLFLPKCRVYIESVVFHKIKYELILSKIEVRIIGLLSVYLVCVCLQLRDQHAGADGGRGLHDCVPERSHAAQKNAWPRLAEEMLSDDWQKVRPYRLHLLCDKTIMIPHDSQIFVSLLNASGSELQRGHTSHVI